MPTAGAPSDPPAPTASIPTPGGRAQVDPATRFTAIIALVSAVLGAVVGGLVAAIVAYYSQQAQFQDERDLQARERKLTIYGQFADDALALIPVSNDLVTCLKKNNPAANVDLNAVPGCTEPVTAYRQALGKLLADQHLVRAVGSQQAIAAAQKVAKVKGTTPLLADYNPIDLDDAINALVDVTRCETALVAQKGC